VPQASRRWEPPGRCEIPDWFDPLRDQIRHELEEAGRRAAANAATRERLETQLEAARAVHDRLEKPTRSERERLAAAERDVDKAAQARDLAEHRLQGCGIRGRRQARRDLAAADNRLTWANHILEQAQVTSSRDVERYHHASHQVRDLREELRGHEASELFDRYSTTDRIPHLQERLDALDTWWRFAQGDKLDVPRLAEIADILGNVNDHHGHYHWLTDTVEQHAIDAGIPLRTPARAAQGIETPGVDISL
jgi:hypothetical protein